MCHICFSISSLCLFTNLCFQLYSVKLVTCLPVSILCVFILAAVKLSQFCTLVYQLCSRLDYHLINKVSIYLVTLHFL